MERAFCLAALCAFAVTSLAAATETVRVTTILNEPFVSLKSPGSTPSKNEDFEGYIPDLLDILSKRLDFKYEIKVVADATYGKQLKQTGGRWSGMVGEIVDGLADLAAAPLTISAERAQVVDFSEPYMTFENAIVMKKPAAADASSTTTASPLPKITAVKDLADQTAIVYGVIKDGKTSEFFRESVDPVYTHMWMQMTADRNAATAEEGIKRVREGYNGRPYAFIIEEPMAEYAVSRKPCDLYSISNQLESKSLALATKKNWALKAKLDTTIAELKKSNELDKLHNKWWVQKSQCSHAGPVAAASALVALLIPAAILSIFVVA